MPASDAPPQPLYLRAPDAKLPALGVPMLGFMLPAGPLWGEKLGMPMVVGLACAAVAVNFTLTYLLARYALQKPLLQDIVSTKIWQPLWDGPPLWNGNRFVWEYAGAVGVKIGRLMVDS